jgi:hypothetical protein
MRASSIIGLTAVVALSATSPSRGNLLVNGGFESPALTPGAFLTIAPGGEPAGFSWMVTSGTVDLGHLPVSPFIQYPAFEGNQALDLNGINRGALFQDFATTPGQAYLLSFAYTDNSDEGGVSTASIAVTDVGTSTSLLSSSVAHSTSTNGPPPDADWQQLLGSFTAIGTTTRLAFASTSPSNSAGGGIILDAVSVDVSAVPEPSSLVMLGGGALSLLGYSLRRRRAARA